jgi:hypothetical protein
MDVRWNVRTLGAIRTLWISCGLLAAVACDADDDAGDAGDTSGAAVDDAGGDPSPVDDEGGGGEPMGCEAPLGEGACASVTICDVFDCGGKTAPFNHFGCPRATCIADADCGGGERCFALALDSSCPAAAGACGEVEGACTCEGADACGAVATANCLPVEFYPAAADCEVAGLTCDELDARAAALDEADAAFQAEGAVQLVAEVAGCRARIDEAHAECAAGVGS